MSESIKAAMLDYTTTLLGRIPSLIETGVEVAQIAALVQHGLSTLSTMRQKGRGPTAQEWDDLNGRIDQYENKVYGEGQQSGAGAQPVTQMRVPVIGGMTGKPASPAPSPSPAPAPSPAPSSPGRLEPGRKMPYIGGMTSGATNDPDPGSDPDTVRRDGLRNPAESPAERAERVQREQNEMRERGSGGPDAVRNTDDNKDGITDHSPTTDQENVEKAKQQGGVPGDPGGVVGDNRGTAPS